MSFVGPFTFNGIRFYSLELFYYSFKYFSQKASKQHIKQSSLAGLIVGFFLCVGYVLQTFGLLYTTSSKAGFLTGLSIVMVPILSFIFKTKGYHFIVIGIAVATAGLYLLTAGDSFQLNIGDILVLGAVAFAAHILVNGFFSKNITFIVKYIASISCRTVFFYLRLLFEDWENYFQ